MSINTRLKHTLGVVAPLIRVRSKMSREAAENLLTAYSPDPNTTCVAHNKIDANCKNKLNTYHNIW